VHREHPVCGLELGADVVDAGGMARSAILESEE
jgi:hypothetical protein